MSPLAFAIYTVLRTLVPCPRNPCISYSDLLSRLPDEFKSFNLENPAKRNELSEALGEIVIACRAQDLPALPALVVQLEEVGLGYPGPGYYGIAHHEVSGELEQLAAWGRELEAVKRTTYPEILQGELLVANTMAPRCVALADEFARRLEVEVQGLPAGFLDSFDYTRTGNNLTHPIVLGSIVRVTWGLPGVRFVGVDVRVNLGGGIKLQPDVVAFDNNLNYLFFADYESPNSSDARVPIKDVNAYIAWRKQKELDVPYLIVTTLPDRESPCWELRWTSAGYYNEAFQGRWEEVARNPFGFWYSYYRGEFAGKKMDMDGVVLVNLNGKVVKRVFPA